MVHEASPRAGGTSNASLGRERAPTGRVNLGVRDEIRAVTPFAPSLEDVLAKRHETRLSGEAEVAVPVRTVRGEAEEILCQRT
jgi:hypothetical protein